MAIEIVEVDIQEMRRAALIGRAKSPAMKELYRSIFSLKPGEARAAVADDGEDLIQLRNMINLCATRTGIDLQIVIDRVAGRVLYTPKPTDQSGHTIIDSTSSRRTPEDKAAQEGRRDIIRAAALHLGRQNPEISAREVVDYLAVTKDALNIARPTTAVAAVMRNMDEFKRIDRSRFAYVGG